MFGVSVREVCLLGFMILCEDLVGVMCERLLGILEGTHGGCVYGEALPWR